MRISDENLLHALDVLRHGGEDAVGLFLEMGRRCYSKGGHDFLTSWVGVAAPALPEADRNVAIVGLMIRVYEDPGAIVEVEYETHTIQ